MIKQHHQLNRHIPPHLFPTLVSVCSLRLCLYFCFANKIVCTTFLDSMSMLIYDTCFLLTDFTLYDSLWVHIPTHVCIEYFLALHLHFIDTFKMHADFKGKTQVFSQLVFCLLYETVQVLQSAKYYFFYFTIAKAREGAFRTCLHKLLNFHKAPVSPFLQEEIKIVLTLQGQMEKIHAKCPSEALVRLEYSTTIMLY